MPHRQCGLGPTVKVGRKRLARDSASFPPAPHPPPSPLLPTPPPTLRPYPHPSLLPRLLLLFLPPLPLFPFSSFFPGSPSLTTHSLYSFLYSSLLSCDTRSSFTGRSLDPLPPSPSSPTLSLRLFRLLPATPFSSHPSFTSKFLPPFRRL